MTVQARSLNHADKRSQRHKSNASDPEVERDADRRSCAILRGINGSSAAAR